MEMLTGSHSPGTHLNGGKSEDEVRRLQGRWLVLGKVLFTAVFLVCVALFAASVARIFVSGIAPCDSHYWAEWELCQPWRDGQAQLGLSQVLYESYFLVLRVVAAAPYFVLSLLLVRRRPEELRVLLLATLLAVMGVAGTWFNPLFHWSQGWADDVSALEPIIEPLISLLQMLLLCGVFFLFTFPDGRFVPRWTRWLVVVWIPLALLNGFFSETPLDYQTWPEPIGSLLTLTVVGGGLLAFLHRYRRVATPVQKQQIKWVVAGTVLIVLNWLIDFAVWEFYPALTDQDLIQGGMQAVVWDLVQDTLWYIAQFLFAVCVGIAIFRHRLWDIDMIVNRTLVFGGASAVLVALYVLVVGTLGALFQAQGNLVISLLATGMVAVLFQPVRERLQRAVNRLMFGERDDPVAVLSKLGSQLEGALSPDALLPNLVTTVAQALKVPYVAVELDGEIRAAHGRPVKEIARWPLNYQAQTIGHFFVAPRAPGEPFCVADNRLLENIAHEAGTAAHAVQLTAALQRSRQRIVTAREEERRRLRRDLHDGLGPQLASQTLGMDAVDRLIDQDPAKAKALLQELKTQARDAITDVRRLVYNLRPPALDDLGLRGALEEETLRYCEDGLRINFVAPEALPDLPAAVEVAAYRIAQEALANVARHSGAAHCTLRLKAEPDSLIVEVTDDGMGLAATRRSGVGLQSMRERAEELNGRCSIESPSMGGTRVRAELPRTELEGPSSGYCNL